MDKAKLSEPQTNQLLDILKDRFEKNKNRDPNLSWDLIATKLVANPEKLWSLNEMETTGGEPDVVGYDETTKAYLFYDCAAETPKGRRSICYDHEALAARKEHKPKNSAINMAAEMGVELLTEAEYHSLQQLGKLDTKTSSWLKTPDEIRAMGGAIFADYRFGRVFVYHNGAESYYGGRGFRGKLSV